MYDMNYVHYCHLHKHLKHELCQILLVNLVFMFTVNIK